MSRIGKKTILLDQSVTVQLEKQKIVVSGPKGKLEHELPEQIKVEKHEQEITVKTNNNSKQAKQLHGLVRTIINNMAIGVSQGFNKTLEIQGVGYRAQLDKANNLILNVGFSHPVHIKSPDNISIKVENNSRIIIHGINKVIVGQIAAQIRAIRPPEPYKGKGIRYDNEIIKKKVGKAGK